MAPGADKRTQAQKALISWNESWMNQLDGNNDRIGEWAQKYEGSTAKCVWCHCEFKFNSRGIHAFKQHANGDKHKNVAAGRKGRLSNQRIITNSTAAAQDTIRGKMVELILCIYNLGRTSIWGQIIFDLFPEILATPKYVFW